MKTKYIILLLLGVPLWGWGQTLPQFSQYINTQGLINPAYTGTKDVLSALAIHRSQYMSMTGTPHTQALNVHSPIGSNNLGIGLSLINDYIGATHTINAMGAVSYNLWLNKVCRLSLGLQMGLSGYQLNPDLIILNEDPDPAFQSNENFYKPNFGVGAYFYSDKFFVGFSIPQFINYEPGKKAEDYKIEANWASLQTFLYGGYVFDIKDNLLLKPTLLMKTAAGAPLQFDIGANVIFPSWGSLGLAYRTGADIIFNADFKLYKTLYLGYSFDFATTVVNQYNLGSHELHLRMDFEMFKYRPGMRSIRYF